MEQGNLLLVMPHAGVDLCAHLKRVLAAHGSADRGAALPEQSVWPILRQARRRGAFAAPGFWPNPVGGRAAHASSARAPLPAGCGGAGAPPRAGGFAPRHQTQARAPRTPARPPPSYSPPAVRLPALRTCGGAPRRAHFPAATCFSTRRASRPPAWSSATSVRRPSVRLSVRSLSVRLPANPAGPSSRPPGTAAPPSPGPTGSDPPGMRPGLSRVLSVPGGLATTRGVGTPLYASPELIAEQPYGAARHSAQKHTKKTLILKPQP